MGTVSFKTKRLPINMKLLSFLFAFATIAQGARIEKFITICNAKGAVSENTANVYKTKTQSAVTRLSAQATEVEEAVELLREAVTDLIVLKKGISVNQPSREAVITKIATVMARLRTQIHQKVLNSQAYRQAAADIRVNAKAAISKVASQFEAWSQVVEDALNALEQRFKGKAVFADFHSDVMDTVTDFATCVGTYETAIADVRKSFSTFENAGDDAVNAVLAKINAALAYVDSNM